MTSPLFSDMLFVSGGSSGGGGGGGGDTKTDNLTINKNGAGGSIQTVGQREKNKNAVTYDWIGTLSEYQTAVAGGNIPSTYTCYITDDTVAEGTSGVNVVDFATASESVTLEDNTIYNGGEMTSLTITLPTGINNAFMSEVDFSTGSSAIQFTVTGTITWLGDVDNQGDPDIQTSSRYVIMFSYDGVNFVGLVKKTA
jgi:hypothetical protein